jgi:hypothetical protein
MPLDKAPSNQKSKLMFFLLKYLVSIATYISHLVDTTRFGVNLHRVRSNILNVIWSK